MDRAAVASGERPGAKPPTPVPAHSRELSGSELYEVSCSACHGPKGGGVEGLVPPLAGNATLASGEPEYLIQTICNGVRAEESRTGAGMPPFNQKLSNGQIAALSTYVRDIAGNTDSPSKRRTQRASGGRPRLGRNRDQLGTYRRSYC